MRLCLLDSPCLSHAEGRIELQARAPGLLLAWLAVEPRWHGREAVAALFWPEASAEDAQRRLRVTLHRARRWLHAAGVDGAVLQAGRQQMRLTLESDVALFRSACAEERFADALGLHRAPLLHGWSAADFPDVDRALTALRDRLLANWRTAALREAERLEAAGEFGPAFELLHEQLQHDLLAEDVVQALLRVAAPAGCRAKALTWFDAFASELRTQLGAVPTRATQALADAARGNTPVARASEPRRPPQPVPWVPAPYVRPADAWAALVTSRRPLTVVRGVGGSGKSRLLAEAWPNAARWNCREHGRAEPLLPVAQMLQGCGAARLRREVPEAVLRRELARLLPALADGEHLPPADATQPRLLPALVQVLPRWIDRLVVDDLQWADGATLQVLRELVMRPGMRVVAAWRSDVPTPEADAWLAGLERLQQVEHVDLGPMTDAMAAQWLHGVTGQRAPRLAAWLRGIAGGNPFLMRQLLQALAEDGPLACDGARWPADLDARLPACRAWPLPQQALGALDARIGRLAEDERRVLQAVAIGGEVPDADALASQVGLSAWAVARHLSHAQAAGWIVDGRLAHDMMREAVVRDTPAPALRRLQAAVARSDPEQSPHRRSALWQAAGDEAAAVQAALLAAQHDRALGLQAVAAQRLADLEQRLEQPDARARVAAQLGWVALEMGDTQRALRHLERARGTGNLPPADAAELHLLEGLVLVDRGDVSGAAASLARAEETLPEHPKVLMLAGHLALVQGDTHRMQACMERLARASSRWKAGPPRASALISQSAVAHTLGRPAEAAALAREALDMARRCRAPHVELDAARNLVVVLTDLGRTEEAVAVGEAALALGEGQGTSVLKNNLARAYKRLQRWDEALRLYHVQTADPDRNLCCIAWANLVDIHARRGAREAVELAVEAALAALSRTDHAQGRQLVLQVVLAHGASDAVRRASRMALQGPVPAPLQALLDAAWARVGLSADEARAMADASHTAAPRG